YWRLNEASGTQNAYDYWGGIIASNNNVVEGTNGPVPPDFSAFETTNSGYQFNLDLNVPDASSWVDGQQTLMNNLGQFSIVGWFNENFTQGTRIGLFGQNDVAEYGFHGVDASGQAQLGLWTPAAAAYLSQTNVTAGQW